MTILAAEVIVLPEYERMFEDFGGTIPGLTRLVLDGGRWVRSNLVLVPIALAAVHFFFVWWDALTRAAARGDPAVAWFRGCVWAGICLYPLFAAAALSLPLCGVEDALR